MEKLKIYEPTDEDWKKLQGGKPRLFARANVVDVVHDYPDGSGRIVPTRPSQLKETVLVVLGDRVVEFPTALIEDCHGIPCEMRSRKIGGKGYPRIESSSSLVI